MKILAMYLPQYHEFKENNEWWGKGFTEWTNTKKAKPLYKNHFQPRIPLNNNYYDLTNDEVRIWQADLAKKYGVDGFVYYHYWFNGKLLMEKPIEMLLKNKNIKTNYCISWANEPWTRSWNGKNKEIIMPQEYGEEKDWDEHFKYLLKFFKDERYIKENNKPLLFIYRVSSIDNHEEMFKRWDYLCKKEGFDGICIVETLTSFQNKSVSDFSEYIYFFEPMFTTNAEYNKISRLINCVMKIPKSFVVGFRYIITNNYDVIWKKILNRKIVTNKKVMLGAFPAWDNTPRRGNKASIIEGASPIKFKKYFSKLLKKANKENVEFIVINAWNEWAEGAYLEPDTKNKYEYLESIMEAKSRYDK